MYNEYVWDLMQLGSPREHSSQNRTGPGGHTVKIENRDENRFFKHKEPGKCGNSVNP